MVVNFVSERERYVRLVEQKKVELPTMKEATFTASIDMNLLDTMVPWRKFDAIAPNGESKELTDARIEAFIKSLIQAPSTRLNPKVIEGAIKGVASFNPHRRS